MSTMTSSRSATPTLAPRAGAPCRAAVRPPARTGRRLGGARRVAPAVATRDHHRVRVTGRGRLMLVLVVAALVVVAFSIGRASPSATSHSGAAQLRTVVVQPGDTLWAIATRSSPGADPRQTVQRIVDLNGLRGTSVVPGQQLRLPVAR